MHLHSDTAISPDQLPVGSLSHIIYAFADLNTDGTVAPGNPAVDTQTNFTEAALTQKFKERVKRGHPKHPLTPQFPLYRRQEGASNASNTTNQTDVAGSVGQLFNLKLNQRNLKLLLSIGGGSAEDAFTATAATADSRATFANTTAQLVIDFGMDGADLDYEYPRSADEGANYVSLLQALRASFDAYSTDNDVDYHFSISVALSASPDIYQFFDIPAMVPYVDIW